MIELNWSTYTLTEARILANQRPIVVGDFLGTFAGIKGTPGIEGMASSIAKRLKRKQVVV